MSRPVRRSWRGGPGGHGGEGMTVGGLSRTPSRARRHSLIAAAGLAVSTLTYALAAGAPGEPARAAAEPATAGGLPGFRRLNESQYVRSIQQIFGPTIRVPGRFDPPLREEGLMAIGDSHVTVSPSGFEQYELRAREIAAQVVDDTHRKELVPCTPASPTAFDPACAARFFASYGRQLYRRPLSNRESESLLGLAKAASDQSRDFYAGLELGLSRLLVSPKFLFRIEGSQPAPDYPTATANAMVLDDYSLATRISFLLWDAPPDTELLDAAERGDLRDQAGLVRQVDRLMASPRFQQGVRSFFADMFGFEQFSGLAKDQAIYPKFNSDLAKDAQEQLLRTLVDHLVSRQGDYRDLFTTKKTFLNRNLGALYKVPVPEAGMEGWAPYVFGADEPRAGILTLAGFLMLDPTHEGRSSPTIRGKSVREFLLCQPIPQPPPNVDFAVVQDVHNPQHRTARQRLTIHQENPACAGCHALTDPIGLSMENYDATGDFRTHENGALIDATGTFEGKPYTGLIQLSRLLHDSPAVPACLLQRAYEYGVGRSATGEDKDWLDHTGQAFMRDKYRFPSLLRRIATSSAFRRIAPPAPVGPAKIVASR
ncbi:DUF1592 domain-containing protein [Sphingobium sufflavum]|uniref:DUF1592 domain-containing protein n=1 Tax=Sphingobium sufflavum TaxID=1129547 RepID=UPI001F2B4774|nr:DUF1592 domain-containing protein [Sphingobium sufflavum]MCE7798279.1 DUF1592 domain-containing protein [Sphingobium sufflavum]